MDRPSLPFSRGIVRFFTVLALSEEGKQKKERLFYSFISTFHPKIDHKQPHCSAYPETKYQKLETAKREREPG